MPSARPDPALSSQHAPVLSAWAADFLTDVTAFTARHLGLPNRKATRFGSRFFGVAHPHDGVVWIITSAATLRDFYGGACHSVAHDLARLVQTGRLLGRRPSNFLSSRRAYALPPAALAVLSSRLRHKRVSSRKTSGPPVRLDELIEPTTWLERLGIRSDSHGIPFGTLTLWLDPACDEYRRAAVDYCRRRRVVYHGTTFEFYCGGWHHEFSSKYERKDGGLQKCRVRSVEACWEGVQLDKLEVKADVGMSLVLDRPRLIMSEDWKFEA